MEPPASISASLVIAALFCLSLMAATAGAKSYEVVYAINAGGDQHTDGYGIHYDKDPMSMSAHRIGTASDYGRKLKSIGRVKHLPDETLYHTERYHTGTFGYDLPVRHDGHYLLVLRFCEVYFNAPNLKVFDVTINQVHIVVTDLDIFRAVGHGVAHEERIEFRVERNRLYMGEQESPVRSGRIRVDFLKGPRDNPKINTIALFRGAVEQVPRLLPLRRNPWDDYDEAEDGALADSDGTVRVSAEAIAAAAARKRRDQRTARQASDSARESFELDSELVINPEYQMDDDNGDGDAIGERYGRASGPRQEDPYALDHSSMMLPVFIAIGAFIPLLVCLCKL